MSESSNHNKIKKLVLTALFFALALVLSLIENSLPPIPIAIPGIRLGLSNIVVMYTLFFLGKTSAFSVAVLKAGFAVFTRGVVAGFLSLCGGLFSVGIMLLLMLIFKQKISYLMLSICGASFHNLGQLFAVSIVYTSLYLLPYLPVLLISGIVAGIATATLLKVLMPAFKRINRE